jgi:hypothetical protein
MTVRLTEDNETAVKQQADAEGLSVNALINKIIHEYTERSQLHDRGRAILEKNRSKYADIMARLK